MGYFLFKRMRCVRLGMLRMDDVDLTDGEAELMEQRVF